MKEFKESGLVFKFDDNWDVYQLDEEADYRHKICKQIPETRCIDFIGFNKADKVLLFIEVKSFRGYGNKTNVQRLTGERDDLTVEIALKVKDSLATLIGGARNSTHLPVVWRNHVKHLIDNGNLKVIAWVELDVSTENLLKRAKINMSTKRKELRKRLIWLTSDVDILNTCAYSNKLEGMEVGILH